MARYHVGELDKLITIKRPTTAADGAGGQTRSGYTNVAADIWAQVHPKSGTETQEHERQRAPAIYVFVIHWRNDILDTDVIEYESRNYQIRYIPDRGSRELYLPIEAERGAT